MSTASEFRSVARQFFLPVVLTADVIGRAFGLRLRIEGFSPLVSYASAFVVLSSVAAAGFTTYHEKFAAVPSAAPPAIEEKISPPVTPVRSPPANESSPPIEAADRFLVSGLLQTPIEVQDRSNSKIGEITGAYKDQTGATYAVIEVGGFLGIGVTTISVAADAIRLQRENDKIVATMGSTKDQLKAMPAFKFEDVPELKKFGPTIQETVQDKRTIKGGTTGAACPAGTRC